MKSTKVLFIALALVAGAMFVGCSNDIDDNKLAGHTYTAVTTDATSGNSITYTFSFKEDNVVSLTQVEKAAVTAGENTSVATSTTSHSGLYEYDSSDATKAKVYVANDTINLTDTDTANNGWKAFSASGTNLFSTALTFTRQ